MFGGLWTDRTDARTIAGTKLTYGRIRKCEYDDLLFWIDNGYLIKEREIPDRVLDGVQADIHAAASSGARQVTFWDERGKQQGPATLESLHQVEAKVLDVHRYLPSVQ